MTFTLDHWDRPRATIANRYEGNDAGYALGGVLAAANVLRMTPWSLAELRQKAALDFGCGTGRLTRALAAFLGHVDGYDPSVQCISVARVETERADVPKVAERLTWMVQPPDGPYDLVVCTCVLYHLTDDEQTEAFREITARVAPGGCAVLQVQPDGCAKLLRDVWGAAVPDDIGKKNGLVVWRPPCKP